MGAATVVAAAERPTPDVKKLQELLFPKREGPNEAHQRLQKANEKERAAIFTKLLTSSGEDCPKVTRTFFQGAAVNGDAFWNVACSNGKAFSIQVNGDSEGSTKIMDCAMLKLVNAGECFKAFPKGAP